MDSITNLKSVLDSLKWYLETNEEKGIVYIPKFTIEKCIKILEILIEEEKGDNSG